MQDQALGTARRLASACCQSSSAASREERPERELERIVVVDTSSGEAQELPADALFILIGGEPTSKCARGWLKATSTAFSSPGRTCWTMMAGSLRGRSGENRTSSSRATLGCSSRATCGTGRSNESLPRSAKAQWRSTSSTANSPTRAAPSERSVQHRRQHRRICSLLFVHRRVPAALRAETRWRNHWRATGERGSLTG